MIKTKEEFLEHVKHHNQHFEYELVENLVNEIEEDDHFFYGIGRGKKVPTFNIFVKSLSEKYPIIGLESKLNGFTAWINFEPHERNKNEKIKAVRDYLGEGEKEWHNIKAESVGDLKNSIKSVLNILTS